MSRSWWPYLASPLEAAGAIAGGAGYVHDLPPAGTHLEPFAFPEPWARVVEDALDSAPQDGLSHWTTLQDFSGYFPDHGAQLLRFLASRFTGPIAPVIGSLGAWPVIWRADRGSSMRWIRMTLRGELGGGVEQFQHKFDFGHPGSDPTVSEAEAATLATDLADKWKTAFFDIAHDGGMYTSFSPEVRYTEVGVVSLEQHDATSSDGSGGDLAQQYPTAWFLYPTNDRPVGAAGTSLPYEVACAVTLQTNHRGPSGRGRSYLPPFYSGSLATGGKFTTAAVQRCGAAIGAFFESVTSDHADLIPVVVSPRRLILNEVTTINVGVIPDSQRRRRRNQDEARIEAWTAP